MSVNTTSFFVFLLKSADDPNPKPKPEWPPVEPSPMPPSPDPVPPAPPVVSRNLRFQTASLN